MPLVPMPASVRPEVQRVVAAPRQRAVDAIRSCTPLTSCTTDDDLLGGQADLLGAPRRLAAPSAMSASVHDLRGVQRLGELRVLVHQLGRAAPGRGCPS